MDTPIDLSQVIDGAKYTMSLWKDIQPQLKAIVEAKEDRYLNYDPSYLLRFYAAEKPISTGITYTESLNFSAIRALDAQWDDAAIDIVASALPYARHDGHDAWSEASAAAFTARKQDGRTRQNEDTIRLFDVQLNDAGHPKPLLKVQRANYYDQAKSNLVLDFDRENPSSYTTLRQQLAATYGNRLPPLSEDRLANTLGLAALIFYWNGDRLVPYVVRRVKEIGVFPGGLHCTASGVAKWPVGRTTLSFKDLTDHMFDELKEEVGLEPTDIVELRPMALCREMARGGKPQLFYAGVTLLSRKELKEKRIHANQVVRATTRMPEIERDRWFRHADVVMTPSALRTKLGRWGLTLEAAGSLHYGIEYLERRLPHLPRAVDALRCLNSRLGSSLVKVPNAAETQTLHTLFMGESHEIEMLRMRFASHPAVAAVHQVPHGHHAWGAIRSGSINSAVVDLTSTYGGIDAAVGTILGIRQEFPEIVFALFGDNDELDRLLATLPSATATRLSHYYRVSRQQTTEADARLVKQFLDWHHDIVAKRPNTARYAFDVAISYAGEDRDHVRPIAEVLKTFGARVFIDTDQQAELWGTNLVDRLYSVYATEARYCLVFVSNAYLTKMWTNHERQAAQDRALRQRDSEYLLPIRIDRVSLPGMPSSIAYLDIDLGSHAIAQLFMRKLGARLGTLS